MSFDSIHLILLLLFIVAVIAALVVMMKKAALAVQLEYLNEENRRLAGQAAELAVIREKYVALESAAAAREAAANEQLNQLISAENRLKESFENLANRIFEEKSTAFKSQSKEHLEAMLDPLKTQIGEFRNTVHQTNQGIHTLKELNLRMAEEATNLTRALKGDNKTQGGWGEQVLGRILDASG
nr:DNA recombination protein RmuC [Arenimonas sp.]